MLENKFQANLIKRTESKISRLYCYEKRPDLYSGNSRFTCSS